MKVRELQEMLEGYDPDDEILVATQPNYPITVELIGVTDSRKLAESVNLDCRCCPPATGGSEKSINVWLVTGSSPYDQPYAPRACWEAV